MATSFTAADFAKWNATSSIFKIPKRLINKESIKQIRVALIQTIGEEKLLGVQALPDCKYRLEFSSSVHKSHYDIHGLDFRGVNIVPTPAFEHIKRVIVDRAPFQMPDVHITNSLSPYGRVVSVQHLTVQGFQSIRTGTRMVNMSVLKPIPSEISISGFKCSIKYRGQPNYCFRCRTFGHFSAQCRTIQGKSKNKRSLAEVVSATQRMDTSFPAESPVNVGASTSSAYVEPIVHHASVDPCPPAMEVSLDPVNIAPTEPASQEQLSIFLTHFEGSVSFAGGFSYTRYVTTNRRFEKSARSVHFEGRKGKRLSCHPRVRTAMISRSTSSTTSNCAFLSENFSIILTKIEATGPCYRRRVTMASTIKTRRAVRRNSHAQRYATYTSRRVETIHADTPQTETVAEVETSNRFAALPDEATDLDALAVSVVDPLAVVQSPSSQSVFSASECSPVQSKRSPLPPPCDLSDPSDPEISEGTFASPPSVPREHSNNCLAIVPYGRMSPCSEDSFSLSLSFQQGGSDHYFSETEFVIPPPPSSAITESPPSSGSSGVLTHQVQDVSQPSGSSDVQFTKSEC